MTQPAPNQNLGTPPQKLYLADNALRDKAGHYYHYAGAVAKACRERGLSFVALTHREAAADINAELSALPTFRFDYHQQFAQRGQRFLGWLQPWLDSLLSNWHVLTDLRQQKGFDPHTSEVVFVPSANHRQLVAWALWWRLRPPAKRPSLVLLFRYSYYQAFRCPPAQLRAVKAACKVAKLLVGQKLVLATDSTRLAQELGTISGSTFYTLPIPHTTAAAQTVSFPPEENRDFTSQPVTFISLGDSREEKGWPLIVDALQTLAGNPAPPPWRFVLQSYLSGETHGAMAGPSAHLKKLTGLDLHLREGMLDEAEYHSLLQQADCVLLPYQRETYFARTSGPLTEAFAAGKTVIAPRDTWLSDQVEAYSGGWLFESGDAADLVRAMRQAATQIEAGTAPTVKRTEWLAYHNPKIFLDQLLALATGKGAPKPPCA